MVTFLFNLVMVTAPLAVLALVLVALPAPGNDDGGSPVRQRPPSHRWPTVDDVPADWRRRAPGGGYRWPTADVGSGYRP